MTGSTKEAAALSFATQISTKIINFGLSVLFVRLAPSNCIGYFTLLIAAAQLVCSLGRVGTNYSYAVLLPKQSSSKDCSKLTATYSLFGLAASATVSAVAMLQLANSGGMPEAFESNRILLSGLTLTYLIGDSLSETIWSIHLATGNFKAVFLRDVWVALAKGALPLVGSVTIGPAGIVGGLVIVSAFNCQIALGLLRRHQGIGESPWLRSGFLQPSLYSWSLFKQLMLKGIPFFSVPLVANIILWPLLMNYVSTAGISSLDGLRVAQICSQAIGIISASLIPVLLIRSSHDEGEGERMHKRSFQLCWITSMLIFSLYSLSDTTILPILFGAGAKHSITIARIFVAAAAVQGLSQIPMQRPLSTATLVRLSLLQVGSLLVAAFVAIHAFEPQADLLAYASITLLSPLITVLCLPALLGGSLVPANTALMPQIGASAILVGSCYLPPTGILPMLVIGICTMMIIACNRDLFPQLLTRLRGSH